MRSTRDPVTRVAPWKSSENGGGGRLSAPHNNTRRIKQTLRRMEPGLPQRRLCRNSRRPSGPSLRNPLHRRRQLPVQRGPRGGDRQSGAARHPAQKAIARNAAPAPPADPKTPGTAKITRIYSAANTPSLDDKQLKSRLDAFAAIPRRFSRHFGPPLIKGISQLLPVLRAY